MAGGLQFVVLFMVSALYAEAKSVTCDQKYPKKVTIKEGDTFTYLTQSGTTYEKSNCKVTYKKHKSCSAMKFSCSAFSIHSDKTNCKKGDSITVSTKEAKNVKYCQTSGPDVTTTSNSMKVTFKSNGKDHDTGAVCTVECVSDEPPPTENPTTEGPGSGDCKCGLAKRASKIVGGQVTEVNEYPWQVGLVWKNGNSVWCGASVISTRWILTAAHCIHNRNANQIQVLLGEHDYESSSETTTVRRDIQQIIKHGSYDHSETDYDFALLKMETAINFDDHDHIRPICLPEDDSKDYNNIVATVTGWGTTASDGDVSNKLREVDVKVITNNECKNDYSYPSSWITAQMMCAEAASGNGGKDACQGDSGGPLVTSGTGNGVTAGQNYELIGVVSWGSGCAQANSPGVYSRVTEQLSWIKTNGEVSGNTCPRT